MTNVYATSYFFGKLIHLLKVTLKRFDLLKPKSYLTMLEEVGRPAT